MSQGQVPGHCPGKGGKPHHLQQLSRQENLFPGDAAIGKEECSRAQSGSHMEPQDHVLQRRHLPKEGGELESADDTLPGNLMGFETGDVLSLQVYSPLAGLEEAADEVEEGGLAC